MRIRIKNCPFCGQKAEVHPNRSVFDIGCDDIDCIGYYERNFGYSSKELAIEAWNTRTPEPKRLRLNKH